MFNIIWPGLIGGFLAGFQRQIGPFPRESSSTLRSNSQPRRFPLVIGAFPKGIFLAISTVHVGKSQVLGGLSDLRRPLFRDPKPPWRRRVRGLDCRRPEWPVLARARTKRSESDWDIYAPGWSGFRQHPGWSRSIELEAGKESPRRVRCPDAFTRPAGSLRSVAIRSQGFQQRSNRRRHLDLSPRAG